MDKELIEHITSQLQKHEESYSPGAWERFSEKEEKRRGFVFWPLWVAAALILVCSSIFYTLNMNKAGDNMVKTQTKPAVKPNIDDHNSIIVRDKNTNIEEHQPQNNATAITESTIVNRANNEVLAQNKIFKTNRSLTIAEPAIIDHDNQLQNSITAMSLADARNKVFEIPTEKKAEKPFKKPSFEDLLAQDSKINELNQSSKNTSNSKWEPGVYVATAMGNDNKVNMNYGFSLSYAIDKKLSISSGVSYASLSSKESLAATAPQTLSGRNLESINAKVQGINVPLELKYNISDKLYTGIGVSALAVLNNSQQNTYIVNQVQSMPVTSATGMSEAKNFIVSEKTSEAQPESTLDPDRYIGFYNFSLGYKQKLSKKNNIAIEPFLRLPMKTFSRENLNLTNGGLRLKIDF